VAQLRSIAVYYWSLADPFPSPFDSTAVGRFNGMESELQSDLYPVLSFDDKPSPASRTTVPRLFPPDLG